MRQRKRGRFADTRAESVCGHCGASMEGDADHRVRGVTMLQPLTRAVTPPAAASFTDAWGWSQASPVLLHAALILSRYQDNIVGLLPIYTICFDHKKATPLKYHRVVSGSHNFYD